MKQFKRTFIMLVLCLLAGLTINAQDVKFEETTEFALQFANAGSQGKITYGYLQVPEVWGATNSKIVQVGVAILENSAGLDNADAMVFLQGGPGASGVESAGIWIDHPLRAKNNIVLLDIRGTGVSKPRLCPDLGMKFMAILAKDQTVKEDEEQKTNAALSCKQDLIARGINTDAYNSLSVANDLNALKKALNYKNWNVYGISYGTYMAQVYANSFPEDVKTLILDSAISDISDYYTENTSNYVSSLSKVFDKCKNDPECNAQYPDLETVFYNTIKDLEKNPLSVPVSKSVLASREFIFNAEDFKIAIQQALYDKQFIALILKCVTNGI